jgi:hypothetical protein
MTRYHNGVGTIPAIGDYVFGGINDTVGFNGEGIWWTAIENNQKVAILVSGSDNYGYVGNVIPCSNFDSTPPSGYTATWAMVPKTITAANSTSVPFLIYGGEVGATYYATASLQSDPGTKATATGTITSSTSQTGNINCSTLADGTNVLLDITLVDTSNNRGSLAPVGTAPGNTLTASLKDTTVPSGYSAAFKESDYFNDQTTNTNGTFYISVTNLPSSDSGTIFFTLTSTGGGQSLSSTTLWPTGFTTRTITISSSAHSLTPGTVTVSLYAKDGAGNQGPTVTDTVLYNPLSGGMVLAGSINTEDLSSSAQSFSFSVYVTPSNGQWYITDTASWITITGASGIGNDSYVLASITQNTNTSPRVGYINLCASGTGDILDTIEVVQNPPTCVAPHTLITMSDGTFKKAGDLQVGDIVKTKYEDTLEDVIAPVTAKKIYNSKRVKVKVGDKEIICNHLHRFYVDNKNDFIPANELEKGDILSGKEFISREEYPEGEVVKLTVENAHTYISEGILSHNIKLS